MKLWQAILVGCDRRAQGFDGIFTHESDGKCTSDVLGAAWEATFDNTSWTGMCPVKNEKFHRAYPWVSKQGNVQCPECNGPPGVFCRVFVEQASFLLIMGHLNDDHRWPREKIALEFVKPCEEALAGGKGE